LEIGEDIRLKVQAFKQFYNYDPNNIALSLKNRKNKTIGTSSYQNRSLFFPPSSTAQNKLKTIQRNHTVYQTIHLKKEVRNMEMLANGEH
jgi:LacI family transcriptional regulator